MKYMYPDNLKAKPMLFLWQLKDVAIIGMGAVFSLFVISQTDFFIPLVITAVYAFLSIRYEGVSIIDFIKAAICFFILEQQEYEWR